MVLRSIRKQCRWSIQLELEHVVSGLVGFLAESRAELAGTHVRYSPISSEISNVRLSPAKGWLAWGPGPVPVPCGPDCVAWSE